ncbi:MAG: hypothetical protein EOP43_03925 [Sphingobacteriaceae bacterium]|nr:MAG: hypothetical protein EOP43_03925 [Sphingobacteriaceae bacterium]
MILLETLKELIKQKLTDAAILQKNDRYDTAVYIAGYAIEMALKLKICKLFKLNQGFPENKHEFNIYQKNVQSQILLAGAITQIKDIKHHELSKLLFFSGVEYQIRLKFLDEWNLVAIWNPEMRYRYPDLSKTNCLTRLEATRILIENIL